jgi:hypothetical protein
MSDDALDVRLFDAGDGVTYSFLLSIDDAWKLLSLSGLRRNKPIAIDSVGGQAHLDGEQLWISYRNGSTGVGHVATDYRAACEQLQARIAMLDSEAG